MIDIVMANSCCIAGCTSTRTHLKNQYQEYDTENVVIRFFRIPKVKINRGDQMKQITEKRRRAWVSAIRQRNVTFERNSEHVRVCSLHFHSGVPAYEMLETDPDWVPSLHLGHSEVKKTDPGRSERRKRRAARKRRPPAYGAGQEQAVMADDLCVGTETYSLASDVAMALSNTVPLPVSESTHLEMPQAVMSVKPVVMEELEDVKPLLDMEDMLFPASFTQSTAFRCWRHIGDTHQLTSDLEIACFLLKCYNPSVTAKSSTTGMCDAASQTDVHV